MKGRLPLLLAAALLVGGPLTSLEVSHAGEIKKAESRRQQLDRFANETMDKLFRESPKAKRLYDRASGYAVFDSAKFSLGLSGGGGVGVAIDRENGKRTYMKMGTAGVGLGLGGQVFQLVFLFEDRQTFETFVTSGWEAGASANAVAGRR
ncbi:MAG: hypothetical protein OEQ13_08830, partial [Acidobacteriota bacterium]|nr:hypothetical protein [Acidobacteriota bacterium]